MDCTFVPISLFEPLLASIPTPAPTPSPPLPAHDPLGPLPQPTVNNCATAVSLAGPAAPALSPLSVAPLTLSPFSAAVTVVNVKAMPAGGIYYAVPNVGGSIHQGRKRSPLFFNTLHNMPTSCKSQWKARLEDPGRRSVKLFLA